MKKWLLMLLALALLLTCSACGPAEAEEEPEEAEANAVLEEDELYIALITDAGNIDDQGFNQACWQGVAQFAEEFGLEYAYYRPAGQSDEAIREAIATAAGEGVNVMVCAGSLFETIIYDLQYEYADICFLLMDGEPHQAREEEEAQETAVEETEEVSEAVAGQTAEEETEQAAEETEETAENNAAENVHCIVYQNEQAGYLAGYAAVSEGLTRLGFVGGLELPAVTAFGYGFIQGAEQAAQEKEAQVEINYCYSGSFDASEQVYNTCLDWYNGGTEAIFACGGKLIKSVIQAAEEGANRYVIGVDVDQSALSQTVLTSAMKQLQSTAYAALCALQDNDWVWPKDYAGTTACLGVAEEAVGLPTEAGSWRFATFTTDSYTELLQAVAEGSVSISDSIAEKPVTSSVTVHYK